MTRRAWVHPIADLPSLKRIGISLGAGHNEHLLHHRCGGRDYSGRRFFGLASIRILGRAASLARGRSLQDATRAHGIELSDFGIVGYFDCGEAW
jgi:hypothetical protein